jgi:hypothetical protein
MEVEGKKLAIGSWQWVLRWKYGAEEKIIKHYPPHLI